MATTRQKTYRVRIAADVVQVAEVGWVADLSLSVQLLSRRADM
jgi:hypothetical protein